MKDKDNLVNCPVDVNKPLWDQSSYTGRLNYFFRITNPFILLKSRAEYDKARKLVLQAKTGLVPSGCTRKELVDAKVLYEAAYHPDTGERMNIIGRMSFQVIGGVFIIGILLTFYQKIVYVVLGQWLNQSFNSLVNYTNRNAKSETTSRQILAAYLGATGGAVTAAAGMNVMVKRAPAIMRRWVPFVAVVAANCINIPVMRQRELLDGIIVTDKDGNNLTKSKVAAKKGISLVLMSRIALVSPPMIFVPVLMQKLEARFPFLVGKAVSLDVFFVQIGCLSGVKQHKKAPSLASQMLITSAVMLMSVPMACSLFPQHMSIATSQLEKSAQDKIQAKMSTLPDRVYFNKGL